MGGTKAPEDLLRRIRQGNRFLLTSHVNPDGDAIGSELGLARMLRSLGKGAVVWNRDADADALPAAARQRRASTSARSRRPASPSAFDAVIVLECPSLDRTGLEEHLAGAAADQHRPPPGQPALRRGQLGRLRGAGGGRDGLPAGAGRSRSTLDPETASCLYLTLVTDTGGFRFSNATPAAFEAAAALVREGAHPEQVSQWLYESQPLAVGAPARRDAADARAPRGRPGRHRRA